MSFTFQNVVTTISNLFFKIFTKERNGEKERKKKGDELNPFHLCIYLKEKKIFTTDILR